MNGLVRMDINTLFSPTKISHTRGHSQMVIMQSNIPERIPLHYVL